MKESLANKRQPSPVSKGNVLDDLGFTAHERASIKLKMDLHAELLKTIDKRNLTPRMLETILHQPQPRISELLRGKISSTSAEKLTGYLSLLGVTVKVTAQKAA